MKHSIRKALGLALTLSGPMLLAPLAAAAAEAPAEKIAIPETAAAILQAIDARSAELDKIIGRGALGEVHHQAFAIRDLVAALPGKSAALPAEQLAKLRSGVKFVAILAERLDAAGDANDLAGAKSNYAKLTAQLASIRNSYAAVR